MAPSRPGYWSGVKGGPQVRGLVYALTWLTGRAASMQVGAVGPALSASARKGRPACCARQVVRL